jgi:hypothetical protein
MKARGSRRSPAGYVTLQDEGGAARTAPPSGWSGWPSDTIKSDRLTEHTLAKLLGHYSDGQFLQRSPE